MATFDVSRPDIFYGEHRSRTRRCVLLHTRHFMKVVVVDDSSPLVFPVSAEVGKGIDLIDE